MGRLARVVRLLGRGYVRRRLARDLDGVYAGGLHHAREALSRGPVVFAANHVCWWDGLVVVALDELLDTDSRILMRGDRLAAHPYFAAFGATAVDGLGLRRVARRLDRPGRAAWIFPQGRQRPAHARPLDLRPGVGWLARRATLIPVSLDYRFLETSRPAAVVRFGASVEADGLEAALVAGLDRDELPAPLVPAHPDPTAAARALAWMWRRLEVSGG